jgi:hypothetical protein
MTRIKTFVVALCLGVLAVQSVWAHAPRARAGVIIGTGWSPFWGISPWYYPPPFIVVPPPAPAPPPVYIEQSVSPASEEGVYWYYCNTSRAYYPSVKTCPEAWLPVLPLTEH